jgi:hypothetical protein
MKYMTPELLARFRSRDDASAELVAAEWDQACEQYNAHLEQIRSVLPKAARSLLRHFSLHDAQAVMFGLRRDGSAFSILLELDTPRDEGVQLTYALVEPPVLLKHPALLEQGPPVAWLYDEFEVQPAKGFPTFWHSILFTGGRELRLHFHELKLERYTKVFSPVVRPLTDGGTHEGLESLLA